MLIKTKLSLMRELRIHIIPLLKEINYLEGTSIRINIDDFNESKPNMIIAKIHLENEITGLLEYKDLFITTVNRGIDVFNNTENLTYSIYAKLKELTGYNISSYTRMFFDTETNEFVIWFDINNLNNPKDNFIKRFLKRWLMK